MEKLYTIGVRSKLSTEQATRWLNETRLCMVNERVNMFTNVAVSRAVLEPLVEEMNVQIAMMDLPFPITYVIVEASAPAAKTPTPSNSNLPVV